MFEKLFEKGRIGTMELRNRIAMPPMVVNHCNRVGLVSASAVDYYAKRAKGGAALIIIEASPVHPTGQSSPTIAGLYRDDFIPGLKKLTSAVHRYGAKIGTQIYHGGRQGRKDIIGMQPVGPSAIKDPRWGEVPHALTIEEIEELVEAFGEGARRAKYAGFDYFELHCAHGYLLSTFLTPAANVRTDKYGGSLDNRMRFLLEIVERVKSKVGDDFPFGVRINADDFIPKDGITLKESRIIARMFEEAGIHCISVTAGTNESWYKMIQPSTEVPGCLVPLAHEIKKVVKIPVMVAGRLNNPVLAEQVLREGKADFIAIGRGLMVDPEMPNKSREGRVDDIRMCIACNECVDDIFHKVKVGCTVNGACGNERFYTLKPTKKPKKVLVIGGGPAGMEAARVAALRGHKVSLYEVGDKLGGQMIPAAVPPYKKEIAGFTDWLAGQITKLGVEIHLKERGTPALVSKVNPEAVIVATGSMPKIPSIPGINQGNVSLAVDVLTGKKEVGDRVVVVGGGRTGCETAEVLADKGKKVNLVRVSGIGLIAGDMGVTRELLLIRLKQKGVRVEANAKTEEITAKGVMVNIDGKREFIEADSVVLAPAQKPNAELADQLKGKLKELYVIGDSAEAYQPRIRNAVHHGFRIGWGL
ncbi:MAG: FAD-dependent oxidoreductase [Dehalococcoidia bacterium]|nr:FAD-dependent oxidoreductase [Dehalococcoidia bacterium]